MGSPGPQLRPPGARAGRHHCPGCGTVLAADNTARLCGRCHREQHDQLRAPPAQLPDGFFDTDELRAAFESQHIGKVFKAYRSHPRHLQLFGKALNQELLGRWLGLTQAQVSKLENGKPEQNLETLRNYAKVLHLPQHLLWFVLPGQSRLRFPQLVVSAHAESTPAAAEVGQAVEDISEVMARVQALTRVGDDELMCFEHSVDDFVARYERVGPVKLAPLLARQRQQLETSIGECRSPGQRQRLFRVAGQVSGLLAYMAVNRGRYPLARAYCLEASHLATFAEDGDLLAWLNGTASFCEYYAGDYARAVELAREGLRISASGSQDVRLLINGEARALGKLGDVASVHAAVERAYAAADRLPEVPGVSPCVSFGTYSRARLASNAVTAYVDAGLPDHVALHADAALEEFDCSESSWSQALIRLDLANSIAASLDGDPAEASALIIAALDISGENPIASVVQRSRSFVRSTGKWRGIAAVDDAHDIVRTVARLD